MFLGPISATPLASSVHVVSCKEKALLEVCLALSPEGKQTTALCKIDSGTEKTSYPSPCSTSLALELRIYRNLL